MVKGRQFPYYHSYYYSYCYSYYYRYDGKADLWSVGCILFEMVKGR